MQIRGCDLCFPSIIKVLAEQRAVYTAKICREPCLVDDSYDAAPVVTRYGLTWKGSWLVSIHPMRFVASPASTFMVRMVTSAHATVMYDDASDGELEQRLTHEPIEQEGEGQAITGLSANILEHLSRKTRQTADTAQWA